MAEVDKTSKSKDNSFMKPKSTIVNRRTERLRSRKRLTKEDKGIHESRRKSWKREEIVLEERE